MIPIVIIFYIIKYKIYFIKKLFFYLKINKEPSVWTNMSESVLQCHKCVDDCLFCVNLTFCTQCKTKYLNTNSSSCVNDCRLLDYYGSFLKK